MYTPLVGRPCLPVHFITQAVGTNGFSIVAQPTSGCDMYTPRCILGAPKEYTTMQPMPYTRKFAKTVRCKSVYSLHSINHSLLSFLHEGDTNRIQIVPSIISHFIDLYSCTSITSVNFISILGRRSYSTTDTALHLLEVTSTF